MVLFLMAGHIGPPHKQNLDVNTAIVTYYLAALFFHAQPVASLHEYSDVMVCEWD